MFNIEVELNDLNVTLTLPPCIPLEAVADMTEYYGCCLAPFNPRQLAHQIIFRLPSLPTDRQIERFLRALKVHGDCWFQCYPKKLEEKRQEVERISPYLKIV